MAPPPFFIPALFQTPSASGQQLKNTQLFLQNCSLLDLWTYFREPLRWQPGLGTVHLGNICHGCCLFSAQHRAVTDYGVTLHSLPRYCAQHGLGRGCQSWGTSFGPLKGSGEGRKDIIDFLPVGQVCLCALTFSESHPLLYSGLDSQAPPGAPGWD